MAEICSTRTSNGMRVKNSFWSYVPRISGRSVCTLVRTTFEARLRL